MFPNCFSTDNGEVSSHEVLSDLHRLADPVRAAHSAGYFKTGPGEYGEGDTFIGLTVPQVRQVAGVHKSLPPAEILELLNSHEHEVRLCALIILVNRYKRSKSEVEKSELFALYLNSVRVGHVNNWDLIDTSAPTFGEYLLPDLDRRDLLLELAQSDSLWERRLSIMFTFAFIRVNEFDDALALAEYHLRDTHDLMHKACGWMLREIGKRDVEVLRGFLSTHAAVMPRTELRYAIEKLDEDERQYWLAVRSNAVN
jgi:3-methyladenine DNA glycosylase AlkD